MSPRLLARLAGGVLAAAVGVVPLVVAAPADAGQVGITLSIKGAGYIQVVEGSLEDGASINCDMTANRDHRVALTCPRIRNEEPFEAWVWLRPLTVYSPSSWEFAGWTGCDQTRVRNERTECGLASPAFGSVEKHPVASFRDAQAPTVTNLDAQQDSDGRFTFTWQSQGHVLSECRIVGQPYETCSSPALRSLPEGTHEFQVRAQDESGNLSNAPIVSVAAVDTVLWQRPAYISRERSATFSWSTNSATSYDCSLDGVSIACTAEGSVRLDHLGEGWHTFIVRGRKGGWSDPTPSRWDWKVDSIAPDTSIVGGPAEASRTSSTTATFELSASEAGVELSCRLDGAALPCPGRSLTIADLAPGAHTLSVTATDNAANVDPTPATRSWTVDTTAPDTTLTGGPANGSVLTSTSASFRIASTEAGARTSCTLDSKARTCVPGLLTLSGLTPGTHDLRARSTDVAGNTDASAAARYWTVPVPARSLVRSSGWSLSNLSNAYAGKVLTSTRRNASLTLTVRNARKIHLVAGGGTSHGSVRVYVGSRLVKTVSLRTSRTVTKRVIPITAFSKAWTGKVRIVVATTGRTVRIEGIAAPTR
ncbi:hypothetical protein ASE01_09545 [Nocardioides sp. Root190]|uniref:hypothetical protein n=1 Tax=Nocardioides sp. Root190 TaxID=1736488 RepID=UPI0006F840CB|nr:hypothetical protein [Nocardioides sp. Root190]KRB76998.1 hypothetical protein ASE01_09545 [Nocardioides sp. Root190]